MEIKQICLFWHTSIDSDALLIQRDYKLLSFDHFHRTHCRISWPGSRHRLHTSSAVSGQTSTGCLYILSRTTCSLSLDTLGSRRQSRLRNMATAADSSFATSLSCKSGLKGITMEIYLTLEKMLWMVDLEFKNYYWIAISSVDIILANFIPSNIVCLLRWYWTLCNYICNDNRTPNS